MAYVMQNMFGTLNIEATLKKFQVQLKRVGGGAKFFNAAGKRGESVELHQDLNSNDRERQKNALKRIIANMTLGRDVSQLFADVVKLGQTPNLEVKKLVYLYVLNNAKLQPDKALMAVNTFLQDASHASPIVRSLALRTMLCLRVDSVLEYTIPPLIAALNTTGEADAYVRKTAALGIGKVYHQNPSMFETHGLMTHLTHLLSDTFPVVSSNAAAVLAEIITIPGNGNMDFQKPWASKLLNALPDSTEWGQVYILEALSLYHPANDELETLTDRVLPRLSHANSAIVLAAVKVIAMYVSRMAPAIRLPYVNRMSSAMLTLAKSDPETQYIVCRNAQMLLNVFPDLLSENFDSFFIRFSDPAYVKFEKLRLLLRLVNSGSAAGVIKELAEYGNEVDPLFIAEVVSATAIIAVKVESVAERAAELLKDIVTRRPEMLPQGLVAAMGMLRKYPHLVIDLVPPLIALGADSVTDEEARTAFVWMLGEFCDVVNEHALLTAVVDNFEDEDAAVQAAVLTAVMKVFLRDAAATEASLMKVIDLATRCTRNPDLRDRGLMYYRLLSRGVPVQKLVQIVLGRKPAVDTNRAFHDNMTPVEMLRSVNSVAAVYAQPPRRFLPAYGCQDVAVDDDEDEDFPDEQSANELPPVAPMPEGVLHPATATTVTTTTGTAAPPARTHVDPLSQLFAPAAPVVAKTVAASPFESLFGETSGPTPSTAAASSVPSAIEVVNAGIAAGASVYSAIVATDTATAAVYLKVVNGRATSIDSVVLQVNRNRFSLAPAQQIQLATPIAPKSSREFTIPLAQAETHLVSTPSFNVQVGISLNGTVYTFTLDMPKRMALTFGKEIEKNEFARQWQSWDQSCERVFTIPSALNADALTAQLGLYRIAKIATVPGGANSTRIFAACKMHTGVTALLEIVTPGVAVTLRSARINEAAETIQPILTEAFGATTATPATAADPLQNFW